MQNSFAGVFPLKNAVMRRGAFTLWRHIPLSVLKKTPAFTGTCVRRSGPSSVSPATITHREVIEILDSSDNLLGYISKDLFNGDSQSKYDPSVANAVIVTFTIDESCSGPKLDLAGAVRFDPSVMPPGFSSHPP